MDENEVMEGQTSLEEMEDWTDVENEALDLLENDTPIEEDLDAQNNDTVDEPTQQEEVQSAEPEVEEKTVEETPIPEFDFEINYNGSKEKLSKDEAVMLAQKGKDYDRVREAYDFIKELAEDEGKSVNDYINTTRDNLKDYKIKQLAEEKEISEDIARELYESRVKEKKALASDNEMKAKAEAEAKRTKNLNDFIEAYPNVDPNSIPKEVWQAWDNGNGVPLKYAYMEYEVNNLKIENKQLKTNATNKQQEVTVGNFNDNQKAKEDWEIAWDED